MEYILPNKNNLRINILKYPLSYIFYFSFSFALGIAIAFCIKKTNTVLFVLSFALLFILLAIIFNKKVIILTLFLSVSFMLTGYVYTNIRYFYRFNYPLEEYEGDIKAFTARIVSYNGVNKNRYVYFADVDYIHNGKSFIKYEARIRLYNYTDKEILVGDKIIVRSKLILYKNIFDIENENENAILFMLDKKMLKGVSSIYRYDNVYIEKRHYNPINFMNSYASFIRKYVKTSLSSMPPINYSIANALFIGDKNILPYGVQKYFIDSGMAHLMSVSGLHLGIIYFIIFIVVSFFPLGFYKRLVLSSLIAVFIYIPLTLYSVSVMRASLMLIVLMFTLILGRRKNSLNALMLTAIIILFIEPNALQEISFQFSFLAAFSIIIYMPLFYRLIKKLPSYLKYILSFFMVNITATFITLTFSIHYFSVLNINSLITNIAAIPISFLIILTSFFNMFLYFIYAPLSVYTTNTNSFLTDVFFYIAKYFSTNSFLRFNVQIPFYIAVIITFLFCIIGIILNIKIRDYSFDKL